MKVTAILPWQKLARATLLVALLAGQGIAAAHEVLHWDQPTQGRCATCSLSSHLNAPATVDEHSEATRAQNAYCCLPVIRSRCGGVEIAYLQRAPPFSL